MHASQGVRLGLWILALAANLIPACATETSPSQASAAPICRAPRAHRATEELRVVVVVLDGVRAREVFDRPDRSLLGTGQGRDVDDGPAMPRMLQLAADRGFVLGDRAPALAVSGPCHCSLPSYVEIFTGRTPTGCPDNDCGPVEASTLLDELRAGSSWRRSDVAVIASWDRIAQAAAFDPTRVVLTAGPERVESAEVLWAHQELRQLWERGREAAREAGSTAMRPDRFTAALALGYLQRVRPKFLFVGLGEPDEYAHGGDYEGYLGSLRSADAFLDELVRVQDKDPSSPWVVLVTTDHGRDPDFREHRASSHEAGRSWLVGIGARIQSPLERTGRLADIAPTLRAWFGLPHDSSAEAGSALPLTPL